MLNTLNRENPTLISNVTVNCDSRLIRILHLTPLPPKVHKEMLSTVEQINILKQRVKEPDDPALQTKLRRLNARQKLLTVCVGESVVDSE